MVPLFLSSARLNMCAFLLQGCRAGALCNTKGGRDGREWTGHIRCSPPAKGEQGRVDTPARRCLLRAAGMHEDPAEGYDHSCWSQTCVSLLVTWVKSEGGGNLFKAVSFSKGHFSNARQVTVLCLFSCTAHPGSVDKRTLQEQTALLLSVSREHMSCVRSLLEAGADPDISSKNKETPLYKGRSCEDKCPHKQRAVQTEATAALWFVLLQPVSWRTRTWCACFCPTAPRWTSAAARVGRPSTRPCPGATRTSARC